MAVVDVNDLPVAAVRLVETHPAQNRVHHLLPQLCFRHFCRSLRKSVHPSGLDGGGVVHQHVVLIAHHTGHLVRPQLVDLAAILAAVGAGGGPLCHPVGEARQLTVVHVVTEHGLAGIDTGKVPLCRQHVQERLDDIRQRPFAQRQHVLLLHVHINGKLELSAFQALLIEVVRLLPCLSHCQRLAVPVAAHRQAQPLGIVIVGGELPVDIQPGIPATALDDDERHTFGFGLGHVEIALPAADINPEPLHHAPSSFLTRFTAASMAASTSVRLTS